MSDSCSIDPKCLSDFQMPWLLNRELNINGRQKIMVNAFKLATASQAFWNLMQSAGREGQLVFHCENGKDLELILRYAHLGQLRICRSNVDKIIQIARKYQVPSLINFCENFLIADLQRNTCWKTWTLCKRWKLAITDRVEIYMLENFGDISRDEEFVELDREELETLLTDDRINARDEMTLFEELLRWIEHKETDRAIHLFFLLNCLRLARLSLAEINQLETHRVVVERLSVGEKQIITSAKRHILRKKRGMRILPEARYLSRPRTPHEIVLVFGGGMFCSPYRHMKLYNNRDDSWSVLPPDCSIPTGRVFFETVILGSQLYMLGGLCEKFIPTPSVFRFSFETLQWNPSAPMQESRFFLTAVSLGSVIYAIGGHREGWETLASVERYSVQQNRWEYVAPLLIKRNRATAAAHRGRIYVCGGNSGDYGAVVSQWSTSFEVYDPDANQWSFVKSIPDNVWGCYKLVSFFERLYLIQARSVAIYDPPTNTWTLEHLTDMPEHYSFTVSLMDGEIFRFSDGSADKWRPGQAYWSSVKQPIYPPGWGHQSVVLCGVSLVQFILSKCTQGMH